MAPRNVLRSLPFVTSLEHEMAQLTDADRTSPEGARLASRLARLASLAALAPVTPLADEPALDSGEA